MSQRITLPKVIFGTSGLGNLYVALEDKVKLEVVAAFVQHNAIQKPVVFDSAGKYGAGLALETLGSCLKTLNVKPEDVLISNKLGWYRANELPSGAEPTFEPGVWRNLKYDAVQKISYEGILECYEQGNQLLNGYKAELVSVHDPDEYVAGAQSQLEADQRYNDILEAYRALGELKNRNEVKAIGVGSKDWKMIQRIVKDVNLDWVMIANSMTVHSHPQELVTFMEELQQRGTIIINSAVFNGGFLIGQDYYNYRLMDPVQDQQLFQWRTDFFKLCDKYKIKPAEVCTVFGLNAPGVTSIALSTTNVNRVKVNLDMVAAGNAIIPSNFWKEMKEHGLIDKNYTYV
jgi:D-threo-aldose 1-dehydrogenase